MSKSTKSTFSSISELTEYLDGQGDYIEQTFELPGGKKFAAKLKIFRDADEWAELSRQAHARAERAKKPGGYTFDLPDGAGKEIIKDPNIALMLSFAAGGLIEPALTFTQAAALRRKTGALLMNIGVKVFELNQPEALEEAKNDLGQADGVDLPESPA